MHKKIHVLATMFRSFRRSIEISRFYTGLRLIDVNKTFSFFSPASAGNRSALAKLTIKAINQTIPSLFYLMHVLNYSKNVISSAEFCGTDNLELANKLKVNFDKYGSDKSRLHNYHYIYARILSSSDENLKIFEIGLGTNKTDVVSNMGPGGQPGASLKAFRDTFPNALLYGADIDSRILFNETHIKTFHLDQTEPSSFDAILEKVTPDIFLLIDDGLHASNSNILTFAYGLQMVRNFGWIVIEDIPRRQLDLWQLVSKLLPESFDSYIIQDEDNLVFAVQTSN